MKDTSVVPITTVPELAIAYSARVASCELAAGGLIKPIDGVGCVTQVSHRYFPRYNWKQN